MICLTVTAADSRILPCAAGLHGNGNFNSHGASAYCKGEDPNNATGK
jgi:hypothetical protein